jgi:hypothetical protein
METRPFVGAARSIGRLAFLRLRDVRLAEVDRFEIAGSRDALPACGEMSEAGRGRPGDLRRGKPWDGLGGKNGQCSVGGETLT